MSARVQQRGSSRGPVAPDADLRLRLAEARKVEAEAAEIEARAGWLRLRTMMLASWLLVAWLLLALALVFGAIAPGHLHGGGDLIGRWLPSLLSKP